MTVIVQFIRDVKAMTHLNKFNSAIVVVVCTVLSLSVVIHVDKLHGVCLFVCVSVSVYVCASVSVCLCVSMSVCVLGSRMSCLRSARQRALVSLKSTPSSWVSTWTRWSYSSR